MNGVDVAVVIIVVLLVLLVIFFRFIFQRLMNKQLRKKGKEERHDCPNCK